MLWTMPMSTAAANASGWAIMVHVVILAVEVLQDLSICPYIPHKYCWASVYFMFMLLNFAHSHSDPSLRCATQVKVSWNHRMQEIRCRALHAL